MTNRHKNYLGVFGCILGLAAADASAVDVHAATQIGIGYSDNLLRVGINDINEAIYTAGLDFSIIEESQSVTADVQARINYFDYEKDTFASETLANIAASVDFRITESVLSWMIQDNFGQQIIDTFQPITPDNRENVNFFRTGPNFALSFGQRTGLEFGLRYADVYYEELPKDNQRRGANIELFRQVSESSRLALFAFGEQVEYEDQTTNVDLDRFQLNGRYQVTSARIALTTDFGWTGIETDIFDDDGPLVDVSLVRQMSPFSEFTLRFGTGFSEAGNEFNFFDVFTTLGGRIIGGSDDTLDIENTSDPFQKDYFVVAYGVDRDRTSWAINARWNKETYENRVDLNRENSSVGANIARQISARVRATLSAQFIERDLAGRNRTDEDLMLGAMLSWNFGRRLSLNLQYNRLDRNSDDSAAEYTENRVFLNFRYILLDAAAGQ